MPTERNRPEMIDPANRELKKARAENRRLRTAVVMAQSRFTDLATIIRKNGSYDNAGFMDASAQRLRDALDHKD